MHYLLSIMVLISSLSYAQDKTVVKKVDENIPAKKVVLNMLDGFNKMADNKAKYVKGDISYKQYMSTDSTLAERTSKLIDFYDVCEKSLKYDYDSTAKKFKSDHWAGKGENDKNNFVSIFRQLIESIVYPIANDYFGSYHMTHSVLESSKNKAVIRSIVQNKKKRRMNFIMDWYIQNNNGEWKIYDVDVDGERWVPSFRSQFNEVISKKSYSKLIDLMKKKLKETKDERAKTDKADRLAAKKGA